MSINLKKGEKISLGLSKIKIGLGWDPNDSSGSDFDLDASCYMLDESNKCPNDEWFVFYGTVREKDGYKYSPDYAVKGAKDDQTGGSSDGDDDEEIEVDLNKVDSKIQSLVFTATIFEFEERKQNFGQVSNSYIRLVDMVTNEEIAKYDLNEDFSSESAIEFGRIYKKDNAWKFEAIGKGYKGGLEFLCKKYGIQVA